MKNCFPGSWGIISPLSDYYHLLQLFALLCLRMFKDRMSMDKIGRLVFVCLLCASIIFAVVWLIRWMG